MKIARSLTAAVLLCTAGSGFAAADSGAVPHALSRADVRAQVIEARRNGTMIESEADRYVAETYYLMTGRLLQASAGTAAEGSAAMTQGLAHTQAQASLVKAGQNSTPAERETGTAAPTAANSAR